MEAITLKEARAQGQVIEKIKHSLEAAIDSRARHYQNVYALSFHFARDQTGCAEDSAAFVSIARSLGVNNPQVFTILDRGPNQGKALNIRLCRKFGTSLTVAPHQSLPKLVY